MSLRPERPELRDTEEEAEVIINESIAAVQKREQGMRYRYLTFVVYVVGALAILAVSLISNARISNTVTKLEEISQDTNELVTYVAEVQSPEAQAESDRRLRLLVEGVKQEIECDHRTAIQELIDELEASGHIELNESVDDVTCEGS